MTSQLPPAANEPSRAEWLGLSPTSMWPRLAAYGLATALIAIAAYQYCLDWQRIFELRPVPLHIWAAMPEAGGWQGDTLRVPSGRAIDLTVHGVSGTHTFALAYTSVKSSRLLGPGEQETVSFVAPAPGRYVLHCTTWCSPNHWRMRTTIEVYDPADDEAQLSYPQTSLRYAIDVAPHELEMPHLATVWPQQKPDAALGAALWAKYARETSPQETSPQTILAQLSWPNVTPAGLYESLQRGRFAGGVTIASDEEVWALVAFAQQQATTPEALAQGRALYQQNCAACHGEQGRGDGFSASFSVGQEPDFSDLRAAAGASPALYYAKIARGGMGTGMPNWGTVLTEDELWALVDYLQTFSYTPGTEGK
jgi:mono/diheme cytochrome c family protein